MTDRLPDESGLTEVVDEPSGKNYGVIETQDRAFEPSQLATMSDADFQRRLQLGQLEIKRMREIQVSMMTEDVDYGVIPGTKKPTLFQPGAQILNRMASLRPRYYPERQIGDGVSAPILGYLVRCELVNQAGEVIGEGLGSANSWEKKHRYRYAERICPECGVAAIRPSQYGDKYYCASKSGGCNAKFAEGSESEAIDAQPSMMENPDPHDLDNTYLKMGAKRAYIAATVQAHACSGQFAQDIGDPDSPDQPTSHPERTGANRGQSPAKQRQAREPGRPISDGQVKLCWGRIKGRLEDLNREPNDANKKALRDFVLSEFKVDGFPDLTMDQLDDVLAAIEAWE